MSLAILIGVLAVIGTGCGAKGLQTGSSAGLTDVTWALTGVRDFTVGSSTKPIDVEGTYLVFHTDGEFEGNDGVNQFQGDYTTEETSHTITMTQKASTTVGTLAGNVRVEAMQSIMLSADSTGGSGTTSQFTIDPPGTQNSSTLTIDTGRWTLTFRSKPQQS